MARPRKITNAKPSNHRIPQQGARYLSYYGMTDTPLSELWGIKPQYTGKVIRRPMKKEE